MNVPTYIPYIHFFCTFVKIVFYEGTRALPINFAIFFN